MGKNKKSFSSKNDIVDGEYTTNDGINEMHVVDDDTVVVENNYNYTYDDGKNVSRRVFYISISIMAIFLIYFIFISSNSIHKKYEKELTKITSNYVVDNQINIFDDKLSYISISELKEAKLLDNIDKTLKKCDGYVTFKNYKKAPRYKAYIDCGKYKTTGYSSNYNGAVYAVKKDGEAPVITLNGEEEITLYVNDNYEELGANAIDNVDGDITDSIVVTGNVDTSKVGIYKIVYEVKDNMGNKTKVTRTIKVKSKPTITLKGKDKVEINLGSKYNEEGFEATDAKDGVITTQVIRKDVDYSTPGTKEIVYIITNSQGETTKVIRTITIKDNNKIVAINNNSSNSNTTNPTVNESVVKVAQVRLSVPSLYMQVGESMQIDSKIVPENADNKKLEFTSTDNSIASVSDDGKINAHKRGKVRIKVASTDGSDNFCMIMLTIK